MPHRRPEPDDAPATHAIRVDCDYCGKPVRLRIAREFVRAVKQLAIVAGGYRITDDMPAMTYKCDCRHIVIIPVAKLGLAS